MRSEKINSSIHEAVLLFRSKAAFARAVGVSKNAVKLWLDGKSLPLPVHCVAIEKATQGKVGRIKLRPHDYAAIWPELDVKDREVKNHAS